MISEWGLFSRESLAGSLIPKSRSISANRRVEISRYVNAICDQIVAMCDPPLPPPIKQRFLYAGCLLLGVGKMTRGKTED